MQELEAELCECLAAANSADSDCRTFRFLVESRCSAVIVLRDVYPRPKESDAPPTSRIIVQALDTGFVPESHS